MRVDRGLVGGDLHRDDSRGGQCPGEETPSRGTISPCGYVHVDDLPELVDRPVDVAPATRHFDVGLVDPPAVADPVPARACRLCEQRCEALHPAEDADVIHRDATLCQQLLHIAVGEAVAQVPPHRHQDYIRRKPETSKARSWGWHSNTTTHHLSLPGSCPPPMQQTPHWCTPQLIGPGVVVQIPSARRCCEACG